MKRRNNKRNGLQVLATGSLSIARAHADQALQKTEQWLERELERENAKPPTEAFARLKRSGEKILHSKHFLLAVVILNVVDCVLVLSELILDIHYVTALLHDCQQSEGNFLHDMQSKYSTELSMVNDVGTLFDHVIKADVRWNNDSYRNSSSKTPAEQMMQIKSTRTRRSVNQPMSKLNMSTLYDTNSTWSVGILTGSQSTADDHALSEDIAHALHKASIIILSILVIQTLCKILCLGRRLLEKKIEVFDGVIVIASFTLDLVFIKGLTVHRVQDFVFILAFIVPWRVLRVVNSLVVAVIDHEHFRLKLLYKQKKSISASLKDCKANVVGYKKQIEQLEELCLRAGVSVNEIKELTPLHNEHTLSWRSGVLSHIKHKKSSKERKPEEDFTDNTVHHVTDNIVEFDLNDNSFTA